MITLSKKFHYVIRCSITGQPFASQTAFPKGELDLPVLWDFALCYWCRERV